MIKLNQTQGTEFDVYNHIRKEGVEGENERQKERMEGEERQKRNQTIFNKRKEIAKTSTQIKQIL